MIINELRLKIRKILPVYIFTNNYTFCATLYFVTKNLSSVFYSQHKVAALCYYATLIIVKVKKQRKKHKNRHYLFYKFYLQNNHKNRLQYN